MARPKNFDRSEVLEQAMDLFWQRGYEATSTRELETRLGVGRRSLYDTYGSKEGLFTECLSLYHERTKVVLANMCSEKSARDGIRNLYLTRIEFVSSKEGWRGCLMTNTAVELAPHHPKIKRKIQSMLADTEKALCETIKRGQAQGEISKRVNAQETATYLSQSVLGFNAFARVAPSRQKLLQSAEIVLSVLDR